MSVLRADLLAGRKVALAGPAALGAALAGLGARVSELDAGDADGGVQALVFDARVAFANGERAGLTAVLDEVWAAVLAVAESLIERGPGKLVFIAPSPEAGRHAPAVRAGLENLSRTLSIEWARHEVSACTILPGPATSPEELGELVAYLVSPAGEYFSGCRFELR